MKASNIVGAAGLVSAAAAKPVTIPLVRTQAVPGPKANIDFDSQSNVLLNAAISARECFDISLTRPAWDIAGLVFTVVDYNKGGRLGDITFSVFNAAVNQTRSCKAENIDLEGKNGDWYACSAPDTNFQFKLGPNDINIKGTWNCGGDAGITFTGSGTIDSAAVLVCDDFPSRPRGWETVCHMRESFVAAALTSPITIHPEPPRMPELADYPYERCDDRSLTPAWKVDNVEYTRAAEGGVGGASHLTFDATNLSNDEKVKCSASMPETAVVNSKHSSNWVDCVVTSENAPAESRILSMQAMFDPEYNLFGLRQTWKCNDAFVYIDSPTQFSGTGFLVKKLNCAAGKDGATSLGCSLSSSTFNGYTAAPVMPHTSYSRSCTLNSINQTALALSAYAIDSAKKTASFTVLNRGSGDSYNLPPVALVDDGAWHACTSSADQLPWQLVDCNYSLTKAHDKLAFKIQWYCDDRDPNHAILFKAEAAAALPKEECAADMCHLPATAVGLEMAISSLTWASSNQPMSNGPLLPWV